VSTIASSQFAGQVFSGTITFGNVSSIYDLGFAGVYSTTYPGSGYAIFSFPECRYIWPWAFVSNRNLGGIFANKCSVIGASAFRTCYNLLNISFPLVQRIEEAAF
jgi:hypothetical protein